MKIAMVGYGRMGKEIEQVAKARGHDIVTIDTQCKADFCKIDKESLKDVNVVIDFTIPNVAVENAKIYNSLGINTVMGTTGWYDKMNEVEEAVKDIGFIWSGNFSIGVNVFFRIIENAAKIIDKVEDYDVMGFEVHHKGKADSPSGTAKMIADILLENIGRKKKLVVDKLDRKIEDDELHFASMRVGSIPGTHTVLFDSDADTIELTHRARNRRGFALGAVMAAEWIKEKKGFFGIEDFMNELIGGNKNV